MEIGGTRKRISICMIVKDEEEHLPACMGAFAAVADEWVIVDTGSSDGTPDIARGRGARVFSFPWCDDFSAARNESLRHATGEWILWIDADDRIEPDDAERLRDCLRGAATPAAVWLILDLAYPDKTEQCYQVRAFPNDPRIRFAGRVHEQAMASCAQAGLPNAYLEVRIRHVGYLEADQAQEKVGRNIRLLERDLAEHPDNMLICYYLATHHFLLGEIERGRAYLERAVEEVTPGEEGNWWSQACCLLGEEHLGKGALGEARRLAERGLTTKPSEPFLYELLGKVNLREARWPEAQAAFRQALDRVDTSTLPLSRARELGKLYTLLGACAARDEELSQAVDWFSKASASDPSSTVAPFLAGSLLTLNGLYAQARPFWDDWLDRPDLADSAQFRLGLLDCLEGDQEDALRRWGELKERDAVPVVQVHDPLKLVDALGLSELAIAERWAALDLRAGHLDDPDLPVRICLALGQDRQALWYCEQAPEEGLGRLPPALYRAYVAYGEWDIDLCVIECDRILKVLGMQVTMTLEDVTQVADLFLRIGRALTERGESPFLTYWAFATAERLYPESIDILLELARIDADLGLYDRAVFRLRFALEQDPRQPDVLQFLGSCYQAMGFPEAAEVCLQRLRDLSSEETTQGGSARVR